MFAHVAARVASAHKPGRVVLATTIEPDDDPLVALAKELGLGVHRGPTEDILLRWMEAATAFGADVLVACDGDDVLVDPVYVDRVVERFEGGDADYITCRGLPFGAAPLGVSVDALARVCALKKESNTAGQGRFFADPGIIRSLVIAASPDLRHDAARLTLDYPEDLEFFERLIEALEPEGSSASMQSIVTMLHARPDLVEINRGRQEEYWARFTELYPPVNLRTT